MIWSETWRNTFLEQQTEVAVLSEVLAALGEYGAAGWGTALQS